MKREQRRRVEAGRLAAMLALAALSAALMVATVGCGSQADGTAETTTTVLAAQAALFPVTSSNGAMGYIDRTGKLMVPARFAEAAPFSEGLAAVRVQASGPWGYIDQTGQVVIQPQFAEALTFSQGMAPTRSQDSNSWGFVDATGAPVIAPQFAGAFPFSEGLARVRTDQGSGYITATGEWAIRLGDPEVPETSDYEAVGEFSGGLALVYNRATSMYGYIGTDGGVAITPAYGEAWGFSEGVAAARLPGPPPSESGGTLYGYIDKRGQWVIEPQFTDARPFSEGLAAAQAASNGAWGYIDATGAMAIDWRWDLAEAFAQSVARVARRVGDTGSGYLLYGYAYIDIGGKVIWRDQALIAFEAGVTTTTTPDPVR